MGTRITRSELEAIGQQLRNEGRTIVLANGAFDLLHVGHSRYLEGASAEGDLLIVAVNSDVSVQRSKGPRRPLIPQSERIELVLALKCVDYAFLFDDETVTDVITELKPHVHAKGTDYTAETVPERSATESVGGRTAIVGDPKDHSTTDLIGRLRSLI